jgi:hypothetical protein
MEVPTEWSSFWASIVLPSTACTVKIPPTTECSLTNVALDQDAAVSDAARVVLYVSVNRSPQVAITLFTAGRFESATVDLHFTTGEDVVFTTAGDPVPVHICGYFTGSLALEIDNGARVIQEASPDPE